MFFPLHPDTPLEGRSLETLFAGRRVDLHAMHTRMAGLMRAEGLPYGERTHTYNSRLAQELGAWADAKSGFEAIHDALYRAYFVEGRNISDVEELVRIATSVGLSGETARAILTERRFRTVVDADWETSRKEGVTGVPTFVVGGHRVVGAQPYDVLHRLMSVSGARLRRADP